MTRQTVIDISIVLNAHRESVFIARTLRSLYDAVLHAQGNGLTCELILVLDDADTATRDVVRRWDFAYLDAFRVIECRNRSLAQSRNDGCAAASGRYISLTDADDLMSFQSLTEKYRTAEAHPKSVVLPQFILAFGAKTFVGHYSRASHLQLIDQHPYISQIFAPASLFRELTYCHPDKECGYAFEDWHFNCEVAAHGWQFVTAPSTILFYRQRLGSIMADIRLQAFKAVPPYSRLFDPEVYLAVCAADMQAGVPAGVVYTTAESPAKIADALWGDARAVSAVLVAAGIDPTIDPGAAACQLPYLAYHGGDSAGRLYYRMCEQLAPRKQTYTDVFLLPNLSIGGGEKYLLQVIEALEQSGQASVLVIGTSPEAKHLWRSRLADTTSFLALSEFIPFTQEAALVATFRLVQAVARGARIHIKPSEFGHDFVTQHAIHLPDNRFVYYRWCDGMNDFMGAKYKNPGSIAMLDRMRSKMHLVIGDCESILNDDRELLGQDLPNYRMLPAHASRPNDVAPAYEHKKQFTKRLVWAGRIDAQKRVELLVMIAALVRKTGLGISIDLFGATEQHAKLNSLFIATPNVSVKPPFAKLADIDVSKYDGLLYTSWFDGMPNMILEALAHGLPVIAPSVGGIEEALREGCGVVVPHEFDDEKMARKYCDALRHFYSDFQAAASMSAKALQYIDEQRSVEVHHRRAEKIFGLSKERTQ